MSFEDALGELERIVRQLLPLIALVAIFGVVAIFGTVVMIVIGIDKEENWVGYLVGGVVVAAGMNDHGRPVLAQQPPARPPRQLQGIRVAVVEPSMRPAIEPGDWLLVDPTIVIFEGMLAQDGFFANQASAAEGQKFDSPLAQALTTRQSSAA